MRTTIAAYSAMSGKTRAEIIQAVSNGTHIDLKLIDGPYTSIAELCKLNYMDDVIIIGADFEITVKIKNGKGGLKWK